MDMAGQYSPPQPDWEKVTERSGLMGPEITERLEVPGGWIYRSYQPGTNPAAIAMCFVPDPRLVSHVHM
jgi:hypothetical protein